ncbi:unnamed protein product, partial [marine sediment metagenome]
DNQGVDHSKIKTTQGIVEKIYTYIKVQTSLGETESTPEGADWWERYKLDADPFKTKISISDDDIADLVVMTPIFNTYNRRLTMKPDWFFENRILLCGELGSGKTTLWRYLQKTYSDQLDFVAISIRGPFKSHEAIDNAFRKKLLREISGETGRSGDEITDSEIIDAINTRRSKSPQYHGCIIFIDDLHKNSNYQVTKEFFIHLQGFCERLFNTQDEVGFIIAG